MKAYTVFRRIPLRAAAWFAVPLVLLLAGCYQPAAHFSETEFDFGTASQNSALKHTFIFRNEGNAPLRIDKIQAGWGCTGALLSDRELPAGGGGKIEVTFDTGVRQGKVTKYITVYTNDPAHPTVSLKVHATILEGRR